MKVITNLIYYFLLIFMSYVLFSKLISIESFQSNIYKTGLYSYPISKVLSYFVIILELVSIITLLFNKKIGFIYTLILLIIFTFYISFLNFTGRYEICGCGGVLNGLNYSTHFYINLFIIIIITISINNLLYEKK